MPEPTLATPTVVGMSEDHQLQGCKSMPTQSSLTHHQGVQKLPFLWKPGKNSSLTSSRIPSFAWTLSKCSWLHALISSQDSFSHPILLQPCGLKSAHSESRAAKKNLKRLISLISLISPPSTHANTEKDLVCVCA